jgi:hypothetical protein
MAVLLRQQKNEIAKQMIIVHLKGGLGNQMFQYAAGRRLAWLHDVPLKLDLSWFSDPDGATPRSFALGYFSIHAQPATDQEIALLYEPRYSRVKRFLNSMNPCYLNTHIRSHNSCFDPSILGLTDNILLDGYWQSEKYFSDIASVIRSDFSMCAEPDRQNREMASVINSCNAISIHIRRGDYVTDAKIAARHGVCTTNYFIKAVELILECVERPHFFVFSDDPEWVRHNFAISHAMTIVDHNGPDKAHEDLMLMNGCKHNIIANSSLSWWGAWLNPHPDKIVIAPMRWFNDLTIDTRDIVPASWFQVAI